MSIVHISSGADFLTLRVHERVKPHSQGVWTANWLHCTAEASAGAFNGTVDWQLRNEDLTRFTRSLDSLGGRVGEALLETGDGWLDVRVIRDEQGQIQARCQLVDNPVGGNSLEFRLFLDQTALVALIGQLRAVLERFPVLGTDERLSLGDTNQ
jgi:hypothetical protein